MDGRLMVQTRTGAWVSSDQGAFPVSVCWMPDTSYYSDTMVSNTKLGRQVVKFGQVKQSLSAQLEDELDLKVGQIVKITHIIDKDWFR